MENKNPIERKNLVALMYASNSCYTKVVGIENISEKGFSIDIEEGRWSNRYFRDIEIGRGKCGEYKEGVIGVYDRTKISHLDSMVHDAKSATKESFTRQDS